MAVTEAMKAAATAAVEKAMGSKPAYLAQVALEAAEKARWQPIGTAPKDGNEILLGVFGALGYGGQFVAFWDDEAKSRTNHWQTADGIAYHDNLPTHWQPLPSPPESHRSKVRIERCRRAGYR